MDTSLGAFARIPSGTSPAGIARIILERLDRHPEPATGLLERLAGEELRIKVTCEDRRPLGGSGARRLAMPAAAPAYIRSGELVTLSGVTAARVQLTVIPHLLPDPVRYGLAGEIPFGALAKPHGMKRVACAARPVTADEEYAVSATALLVIGKDDPHLCGYTAEWITGEVCELAARRNGWRERYRDR